VITYCGGTSPMTRSVQIMTLWHSHFVVQIILGTLGPTCGSYSGLLPLVGGLVSVISYMLSGENVSDFFLLFIMNTVPSLSNLFMWSLGSSVCSSQNYWFSSLATIVQGSSLASNPVLSLIAWVLVAYLALLCDLIAFSKSIYPPFFFLILLTKELRFCSLICLLSPWPMKSQFSQFPTARLHSPAFLHSVHSPVRIPALRRFPAL